MSRSDVIACTDLLLADACGIEPMESDERTAAINYLSAYDFALKKDSAAKRWWNIDHMTGRAAIYRALQINPADHGAAYACYPFRLARTPDGVRIVAAWPAPATFGDASADWLGITHVIEWNPVTDTACLPDDPVAQIVGNLSVEANVIFSSPRAFFQRWAINRARFAVHRQTAKADKWHMKPAERDETPGALIVGNVDAIRWNQYDLPPDLQCADIDPKTINRAILKAARLPRARAA